MPKKVYRIRKFEGGLNQVSDPKDLQEGQFSDTVDVSFDKIGQARNIGAAKKDTDINNALDGNAIVEGRGLMSFSSSHTYQPNSSLAVPTVNHSVEAVGGTKAFGTLKVIGGYLDTSVAPLDTPSFKINWTTTTGGHSAVEISDPITSWFTNTYVVGNAISGSLKSGTLQSLISTKIDSESSTPNFDASNEGDSNAGQIYISYDTAVGATHDYDSDGAAENTAGVLSVTGVASVNVTLGGSFTEEQVNMITTSIHNEANLGQLNNDYILIEIIPNTGGTFCGFILLHKTDVANGVTATAHSATLTIGNSNSQATYVASTTTTYSFTLYDETSNTSDTTSLTTTGASNDTASEVAAALEDDYDDAVFENIGSAVLENVITFANSSTNEPFTISATVTHSAGNTELGEDYLIYVSSTRKLHVFPFDRINNGASKAWKDYGTISWSDSGSGTGWATDTPNVHMYSGDGALRIVDRDFSNNLINAWFGYVGRNTTRWAGNSILNGWKTYPQALTFVEGDIRTRADSSLTTPSSDELQIKLTEDTDGTGFWNGKYKFFVAAVFDDDQESLPSKLLEHDGSNLEYLDFGADSNSALKIDIAITPDTSEPFDNGRITGFSIYYTKDIENYSTYYWLGTLDEIDGWRGADGQTAALSDSSNTAIMNEVTIVSDDSPHTYESRGFPSPLNTSIHAFNGTDGLKYKTSCIVKNRLFVGNLSYGGKSRGSEMCVSPYRKFDTLPVPYGIITVNNNDGDDIVHLEASGDRILQYKRKHLYVVNVAEIGNETVEGVFNYKGVTNPNHVVKVRNGIAWVNKQGVYLFNDNTGEITNLFYPTGKKTGKRIATDTWSLFFSDDSTIGYDSVRNQLLIKKSVKATSTSGDIYLYDFTVDAWSFGDKRFSKNAKITNFVVVPDGYMLALRQGTFSDTIDNGGEVPI